MFAGGGAASSARGKVSALPGSGRKSSTNTRCRRRTSRWSRCCETCFRERNRSAVARGELLAPRQHEIDRAAALDRAEGDRRPPVVQPDELMLVADHLVLVEAQRDAGQLHRLELAAAHAHG